MKSLEDTLAVLSLGKFCEEHIYTHGWASGQKPHLTKQGKKISLQDGQFRNSCCSWIVANSGTSSSSTSIPQDSSSTTSSPATERRDDRAPGKLRDSPETQNKNKKGTTNQAARSRLRHLPEWLEECTDNLEDIEVPAPAHISHDSDSERPSKGAARKRSIFTHFVKDRNCEVCLRTKMRRALCRGRTGEAVPRADKFGDLIAADQKVPNEERNNLGYGVVVQDLATPWIQSCPSNTKTSQQTEKSFTKVPRVVT